MNSRCIRPISRWAAMATAALPALLIAAPAHANDSVYGGCSGVMSGVASRSSCVPQKHDAIALIDEKLTLTQTSTGWSVVATYTLENTGSAPAKVSVGFPISSPAEPGDEEDAPKKRTKPPLPDYKVTLDGKALKFGLFFPHQKGDQAARAAAEDFGYDAVYLVDVTFAPGQKRVLEHRYSTPGSANSIGLHWVDYILRTGANWKGGTIGAISVDVVLNVPIAQGCHGMSLAGWRWLPESRTMHFEAKDWRPTVDLHATWVDANHRFGAQLYEWASAAGLSVPDLLDGPDALAKANTAALASLYGHVLGFYGATEGAKPEADITEGGFCEEGLDYRPSGVRDPKLRLSELTGDAAKLVPLLDAELTRRKADHPKPPAP